MDRILNLTQHRPTSEQIAAGVTCGDINDLSQPKEIAALLTFDTLPTPVEVRHRAERLAEIASKATTFVADDDAGLCANESFKFAMIGGAPYLMAPLEVALRAHGITPMYAFSVRESVDQTQPDGSVRKVAVFRHAGFVGCEIDEPDTVEVMPANKAAELYVFVATECDEEWKKSHATKAESVNALFESLKASDDAYNLELCEDGLVGRWSIENYYSLEKTAEIKAVQYFGIVYQF